MLLKEVINQLVYGELSTLPLGDDHESGELLDGYDAIMPHINLAITAVHKRLYIRQESVVLTQDTDIKKYILNSKFSYIADGFLDNSLKIEKVVTADGEELLLNDSTVDNPIYTPTPNRLDITTPVSGTTLTVTFRANHPAIDILTFDPDSEEIDIPEFVLEPILYYIASRVHASYPSLEGTNESLNYRQKYEAAMAELSEYGLVDTSGGTNIKLETNGWV